MPRYTTRDLEFSGGRSILSPQITRDDNQEDFANSWLSGRWVAGMYTIRYVINNIAALGFDPNGATIHDFGGIPGGNSAYGHLMVYDAVIESRITAVSGSYTISLGDQYTGSRNNIILTSPSHVAFPSPVVYTDQADAAQYPANLAGRGGRTLDIMELGIRWVGSSLTGLVTTSRLTITVAAYFYPNQLVAGA
jgi:hypothetical protein